MQVTPNPLLVGNIYVSNLDGLDGATNYNTAQAKTVAFKNNGDDPSELNWSIDLSGLPAAVSTVSPSSGTLDATSSETVTVTLDPAAVGSYVFNILISINAGSGSQSVTVTGTVYDAPTVRHVSPAIGSNGVVNVPTDELTNFKIFSPDPLFPSASIGEYEWQEKNAGVLPSDNWPLDTGTSPIWSMQWASAGDRVVYGRMVDDNEVATEPIAIPVKVSDRPVVDPTAPSSASSWGDDKYAGVVNVPMTLQATSDLEPTLSASGLTTPGKVGSGAGDVSGTNIITLTTPINLEDIWTITAWFKLPLPGGMWQTLARGSTLHHPILVRNGANLGTFGHDGVGFYDSGYDVTALSDGWHHIAAVGSSGTTTFYIDGNPTPVGVSDFQSTTDVATIGNFSGGNQPFGTIDDVGIFRRALSTPEISDLMSGITGRENGLVYFNTFDFDGSDSHKASRYLWYDDADTLIATQLPRQTASVTFGSQNLAGKISCVAVTNHGIESEKQLFDLKVYPTLQPDSGGPYVGRPNEAIALVGSVNTSGYPGATFTYQWEVDTTGDGAVNTKKETSPNSDIVFTWTVDGNYAVELTVTATTQEGLIVTATDTSTVKLESGVPTAFPGGPYRGGIEGGNFSPIQLMGDGISDGTIDAWQWTGGPTENGLTFDGLDDYVAANGYKGVTGKSPRTVMAWIKTSTGDRTIVSWGTNIGGQKWTFRVSPTKIRVEVNGGFMVGTTNIVDDQWHHVAAVLPDMDTPNVTHVLLYVDGALEAISSSSTSDINTAATTDVRIGTDFINRYFDGSIDDVAIFDRALDISDIKRIYENAITGAELDLVAYWGFEEGEGDETADLSNKGNHGTLWDGNMKLVDGHMWFGTKEVRDIQSPACAYADAGRFTIGLRVKSNAGKWSPLATEDVTVVDGKITGRVVAADLRTSVKDVTIALTSSHVDTNALSLVAANDSKVTTTSDDGLSTLTDENGKYQIEHLPLGSYRLVASKVEGNHIHEFEKQVITTELTLDSPNQLAIDYVDISVFPVGGQVYYSILKNEGKVYVPDVTVTAQPVGNASPIQSLPSTKSIAKSKNYNLPLFAGKYLFLPQLAGHDIRLIGTDPSEGGAIGSPPTGYDLTTQLMTIEDARTDIDFIDYTTRDITVFVEDSGEFPIYTHEGSPIEVSITGTNGAAVGEVNQSGASIFQAPLPPGVYTVKLTNVTTAIVKGDLSKKIAEIDVTGGDDSVTMVVPVKIDLTIGPAPLLFGVDADFLEDIIGLTAADNPEGFMFYFKPEPQTHTYIITATANSNTVADFTLEVTDNIGQTNTAPASTVTYPNDQDDRYNDSLREYTVTAGIPNATVVNESNLATYVDITLEDGSPAKVPIVLPKTITFRVSKDRYETSNLVTLEVTVLGDLPEGSVSEIVSVPNINYLVLHDPPGDGSYAYLEDSMTIKGVLDGVTIKLKDKEIPVHPSPWSSERNIKGGGNDNDLGKNGLLGYRNSSPTAEAFFNAGFAETLIGAAIVSTGPLGYALQFAKLNGTLIGLATGEQIVYEVSPNRTLRTPIEDEIDDLPDKMGPGKGDLYYGEGWTLGLQTKFRLGIKQDSGGNWVPDTALILTYDILERTNQYLYNIPDIERIIGELALQISALEDGDEKDKLTDARNTWLGLLNKNPAYLWRKDHIEGDQDSDRQALEGFLETQFGGQNGELLLFTGGTEFNYSRAITESNLTEFSSELSIGTESTFSHELENSAGFKLFGTGITIKLKTGSQASIGTSQGFSKSFDSGTESKQTVGFVLADGDVWDSYATYTYEGPWGTPIFFTDPGSVTSWPWQQGTTKGVDVQMELISTEDNGPFDYRDGAHYQFKVTSTGVGIKEGSGFDFIFYDLPIANPKSATIKFNGSDEAPYTFELFKGFSSADLLSGVEAADGIGVASANITVSIYPPQRDWDNTGEVEYPVVVQSESAGDYQIAVNKMLRPRFADLRAPRATITAPYDGQRISPVFFSDEPFEIEVFSDDEDIAKIQVQMRTKQPDGVFEPWQNLGGVVWEDGVVNPDVAVVTHTDRDPQRREFTFNWDEASILSLGVGEYQLRAVAQDAATRLATDGVTQELHPNVDLDAPIITFRVDTSDPTVLTTTPDYQAKESERIYRSELSALFNDDMRADDFSDRTFAVVDLLDNNQKVAGFVSYSPTLRKAIFVPVVPFQPNGFYKATIKTDSFDDGGVLTDSGVHDLAGNPLDNEFSWTFRTNDSPFEETWSIVLSATDANSTDGNNIASVEFGAEDAEDERDARAVPIFADGLELSFIDSEQTEFDRDTRPADGRLFHRWFFVVKNPTGDVTLRWKPSTKLIRSRALRQYKEVQLVEFVDVNQDGNLVQTNIISLEPSDARDNLGLPTTADIYTFTTGEYTDGTVDMVTNQLVVKTITGPETVRYFRLDVMKASFVATEFQNGLTGWKFFSVPITPERADPFVNFGDDIDLFQMFDYDTETSGYKVYPLDIGEVRPRLLHAAFQRCRSGCRRCSEQQ